VPENERDRGLKFIRADYVWFILALLVLPFTRQVKKTDLSFVDVATSS
jgi:hypothetical protein